MAHRILYPKLSVTGDWELGIALLVRTLRVACFHVVVRLRSVTRDWGLGIGDWRLGIGDCTSGADATRSLLPRSGTAPLCYQGLGIGNWGLAIGGAMTNDK
ncbi:MAG: hypothetical protein ACFKPT_15500 [Gloeotrichia echinulata GP01]